MLTLDQVSDLPKQRSIEIMSPRKIEWKRFVVGEPVRSQLSACRIAREPTPILRRAFPDFVSIEPAAQCCDTLG